MSEGERTPLDRIAWLISDHLEVPGEGPCKGCYRTAHAILAELREPGLHPLVTGAYSAGRSGTFSDGWRAAIDAIAREGEG